MSSGESSPIKTDDNVQDISRLKRGRHTVVKPVRGCWECDTLAPQRKRENLTRKNPTDRSERYSIGGCEGIYSTNQVFISGNIRYWQERTQLLPRPLMNVPTNQTQIGWPGSTKLVVTWLDILTYQQCDGNMGEGHKDTPASKEWFPTWCQSLGYAIGLILY